ncbi:MAG: carbohydrate ABC transporter permease [Limnochordales bacterium]|nr:carbohydrate ABC transporter permease [Limnochordales bacterium]
MLQRILFGLTVVAIVVISLAPFVWQVISSITTDRELLARPPHWLPEEPTLDRYRALILGEAYPGISPALLRSAANFRGAFVNSLTVAPLTTLASLVLGTLAAYALTRLRFPGRQGLFFGILAARMLPPISLVIPLYLAMRALGLMDTRLGLGLVYLSLTLPLVVWIMSAYFRSIPWEIEEAAMIDGCSPLGALVRVILPLSAPGLVAAGVVTLLFAWNEFFFSLIFTQTLASKTLPKAISEFSTELGAGLDYGLVTAGGVLTSLPPIAIALFFQRYLVRGLVGGATKG